MKNEDENVKVFEEIIRKILRIKFLRGYMETDVRRQRGKRHGMWHPRMGLASSVVIWRGCMMIHW